MTTASPAPLAPSVSIQQFVLAILVLLMAGAFLGMLFFVQVPKDNQQLLTVALGIVLGVVGTLASFYWPSSVGSKAKDDAISALVTQVAASPPTVTTTTVAKEPDPKPETK